MKEANATRYRRFDKVGWGSPVRTDAWPADARWFGNAPQLVLAVDGEEAQPYPRDPGRGGELPLSGLGRLQRRRPALKLPGWGRIGVSA